MEGTAVGTLNDHDQHTTEAFAREVQRGERFTFGANWQKLLPALDAQRLALAEASLRRMLGLDCLQGQTFLDVGSGSGLFSLAARRLGARVHSFDYDPQSVACTEQLRQQHFPDDPAWTVAKGSILDLNYLQNLGTFDIVYSWGVLHHTGSMWPALANVATLVKPQGRLFIAIYNDQGKTSQRWRFLKKTYNRLPRPCRPLLLCPLFAYLYAIPILKDCVRGRPLGFWRRYKEANRGMSVWRDLVDWVGGYPFEVAKPEAIFSFFRERDFTLTELVTVGGGLGCNEFVFRRV